MVTKRPTVDVFRRNVICFCGFPMDIVGMEEALTRVAEAKTQRYRTFISTPNVNFLVRVLWDEGFRRSVIASDLVVADGMPLIWLCRLIGVPIPERVAGSDLFDRLTGRFRDDAGPLRVFFFGGREGAAEQAHRRLCDADHGVKSVGFLNPGFGGIEEMSRPEVLDRINDADADFVIVSLGAAKGQDWIMHTLPSLAAPLVCHLGAVVDFVAGTVKRSPRIFRVTGLEWAYRISQDPGLWRRYFDDGLALFKLLCLSFLPMALDRVVHGNPAGKGPVPAADCQKTDKGCRIVLAGGFHRDALEELRAALVEAADSRGDVSVDLGTVTAFDLYAQGQLLLLLKLVGERNGKLRLENVPPALRRQFRRSGLDLSVAVSR